MKAIFLSALFAATMSFAAEPELPVVLLTAFEPFGGEKVNPSWESVKTLQGKVIAGHRVETLLLPVVYDEMDKPLQDALAKHKPAAAISFGVGSTTIQIETKASNGYHPARPLDNKNIRPTRKIIADAPAEIPTGLPAAKIVAALKAAKIGASESTDAGGYLCNECFFRLMHAQNAAKLRGFVHVPYFNRPDPEGGTFDTTKHQRAVELVVKTALTAEK